MINLVDTPGHSDFSEDTYRVLTAVDAAVMLIDAAKGLEPQTLKLFQVCRHRGIPVITVINKWDRPGQAPLELLDEISERIGLTPTPLYWPVGIAGDFRGLLRRGEDGAAAEYIRFTRTAGGAKIAPEELLDADAAPLAKARSDGRPPPRRANCSRPPARTTTRSCSSAGQTSPVIFASAMLNFGVRQILDTLVELAPPPRARHDIDGTPREVTDPFSAVVFKVQAGMDTAHRDRLAFMRIVSGVFERGMVVTHAQTGKPFTTKYAQTVFGRERSTVESAYPGDVVGLVNATALAPGHTLYIDKKVEFPPIPSFAPEHFSILRAESAGKYKQFRRGSRSARLRGRRADSAQRHPRRRLAGHGGRRPDAVRGGRGADEGRVQRRGPDGAAGLRAGAAHRRRVGRRARTVSAVSRCSPAPTA